MSVTGSQTAAACWCWSLELELVKPGQAWQPGSQMSEWQVRAKPRHSAAVHLHSCE